MKQTDYDKALFEAYIGTPSQYEWYAKAFDYFDKRGGKLSWYWNGWAFLGGFWYFLYRKQMKVAMIFLFIVLVMSVIVPIHLLLPLYLALSILAGGFGTYFIYRQYLEKRKELALVIPEKEKHSAIMRRQIGGVNAWVIPVAIVALLSFVLTVAGLMHMAGKW
jgi:hypothetical protein